MCKIGSLLLAVFLVLYVKLMVNYQLRKGEDRCRIKGSQYLHIIVI
jgi:hypothetical protein